MMALSIQVLIWTVLSIARAGLSSHYNLYAKDNLNEVELDLKFSAQKECLQDVRFTTIDTSLSYLDRPDPENERGGKLLQPNGLGNTTTTVVLSSLTSSDISAIMKTPVTITHSNTGIAVGMTNGIPKAVAMAKRTKPNPWLPLHHPGQNMSHCASIAALAERQPTDFYSTLRKNYKLSYVRLLQNGIVHKNGYVGLQCGWIQPRQGCISRVLSDARIWYRNISATIAVQKSIHQGEVWTDVNTLRAATGNHRKVYDRVFVIGSIWDYNYHHFLHDSLARLIRFYHFLRRNRDINIHVTASEEYFNISRPEHAVIMQTGARLRQQILSFVGFPPERIITGQVIARTVYLPNDIECVSALRHPLELKLVAQLLMNRAQRVVKNGGCSMCPTTAKFTKSFIADTYRLSARPVVLKSAGLKVVVQSRPCPFIYNSSEPMVFANKTRASKEAWRCFTQLQMDTLVAQIPIHFPDSETIIAGEARLCRGSGEDSPLSLACDIALHRQADVSIGLHGAAMTNVMFMRPGSVLVEIIGQYDGRMVPVCGFHGPLAAVYGVHHYIYYYDGVLDADSLDLHDVLRRAKEFVAAVRSKVIAVK